MRDGAGLSPLIAAAIILGASALALLLPWLPSFRALTLGLDDLLIAVLAPAEPQHRDIALVAIDEDTLAAAACRSPIDRFLLAGMVERLDAAGVRAIGLDVLLDQPTTPEADARLARVLRQARAPVVAITAQAGTVMGERQRAWHADYLAGVPTGIANLAKDRVDGVVRRYRVTLVGTACRASPRRWPPPSATRTRPTTGCSRSRGTVGRRPTSHPFRSTRRPRSSTCRRSWLAGRVVLVGTTLDGVDRHRTPLSLLGPDMAGSRDPGPRPGPAAGRPAPTPAAGLARPRGGAARGRRGLLVAAAGLGLAAQLGVALLVPLAMLGLTAGRLRRGRPARLAAAAGGRLAGGAGDGHLRPRHARAGRQARADAPLRPPPLRPDRARDLGGADTFLAGGRPRPQTLTATVLFSDIEGFTAIAESLGPEALMRWLEAYFDRMVAVVDRHGGVVLRFIGDAIFAAFGVPVPRTGEDAVAEDARRAVACALAMADEVGALNADLAGQNLPRIGVRIGIQTGLMTAGSLGRSAHLEYALMGDAVNTAARLEAYAKTLRGQDAPACTILVGAATRARLGPEMVLRAGRRGRAPREEGGGGSVRDRARERLGTPGGGAYARLSATPRCSQAGTVASTVLAGMGPGTLRRLRLLPLLCLLLIAPAGPTGSAASRSWSGSAPTRTRRRSENPTRDAKTMADTLGGLGFQVDLVLDPDYRRLSTALREFGHKAADADLTLVYFAGHGVQVEGQNFLIPADAQLERERDLVYEALPLNLFLSELGQAKKLGIMILDACRDNPFVDRLARRRPAPVRPPCGRAWGGSTTRRPTRWSRWRPGRTRSPRTAAASTAPTPRRSSTS